MQVRENDKITLKTGVYTALSLLGKGKSGYSWLVESPRHKAVLKLIHDEPCPYYNFGDKLGAELSAYDTLSPLMRLPRLLESDGKGKYLLKEYFPGGPLTALIASEELPEEAFRQIFALCAKLYPAGLNLDYFPANFIWHGGELVYIDYECNPYSEEWNFENWGIYYWLNTAGMREFLASGNPLAINIAKDSGKPIAEPFRAAAEVLKAKYARRPAGQAA